MPNKPKRERYNKDGITNAHLHLLEIWVAHGDNCGVRWTNLVNSTKLIETFEPAFPEKSKQYIADKKYKLVAKKKADKFVTPAFNSRLIFGAFEANSLIDKLFLASSQGKPQVHWDLPSHPPTPITNENQPATMARDEETIQSFTNADGEVEKNDDVNEITNALAAVKLKKKGLKFDLPAGVTFKKSWFSLEAGVNPHDLMMLDGGTREVNDGSGLSAPHMLIWFSPKSVKDLDHVKLELHMMTNGGTSSTMFKFSHPAISNAVLAEGLKFLGNIGAQAYADAEESGGSAAEKNKLKMEAQAQFQYHKAMLNDELSKGFDGDGTPKIRATYIATPGNKTCHNGYFNGATNTDPTFLQKCTGPIDCEEVVGSHGTTAAGDKFYAYWVVPYFGKTLKDITASPQKPRAGSAAARNEFLRGVDMI